MFMMAYFISFLYILDFLYIFSLSPFYGRRMLRPFMTSPLFVIELRRESAHVEVLQPHTLIILHH